MKAVLRTRCGCTREMQIPYPPNREIYLPLSGKMSWFHVEMDAQRQDVFSRANLGVRVFELYNVPRNGDDYAEYLETKERRR